MTNSDCRRNPTRQTFPGPVMPKASHIGTNHVSVRPCGDVAETSGRGHSNLRKTGRFWGDGTGLRRYLNRKERKREVGRGENLKI